MRFLLRIRPEGRGISLLLAVKGLVLWKAFLYVLKVKLVKVGALLVMRFAVKT